MGNHFVPRVGGVLSADIAVPEHEREVRFYAQVLGTGDEPRWREDLMNNLGVPVIGLGARTPEYEQLPLQWMPHIQVADVAASAQRALELGGRELLHGRDDKGQSLWAGLLDPNGVAFGIIPVPPADAVPTVDDHAAATAGHIAWLDLTVPNAAATRDFYQQVVGWSAEKADMEDAGERYADYTMLDATGQPVAGVCHARGVNADVPPVWMLYLPVSDLTESVQRVRHEGGAVLKETRGSDGALSVAIVQDPVGVILALAAG
ncbi:MAG: VOC family protein [Planctomycetota bacterium]